MDKPVIVIVPGAWHRPQHFKHLIERFNKVNYEAVGVDLPSVDSSPPLETWEQDAQAVRKVILEHLDAGKNVIALAHSFGGIPMSEAVKGLGKESREKQGLESAVIRLVYMCAMAMPEGQNYAAQTTPITPEEQEIERRRQEVIAGRGAMKFTEVGSSKDTRWASCRHETPS